MLMGSYGKAKGNFWENIIFRDLRDIMPAYKSIGSGNGLDSGDILTDEYCIEAKFHKSLTDGQLDKFWLKIVAEAEENKRQPVLIYKENRKRPIVMFFDYLRGTRRVLMFYDEWLEFLKEQQDAKTVSYPNYDPVKEAKRFV